ncbi:MAG: helix-turn-helix domain-containing protein [Leptospirales bacterium]
MKYHFKIHNEENGYWAQCIELEGCITEANDMKKLQHNMIEVLNLYLDESENSEHIFALPRKMLKGKNVVKVAVHPKVAFAMTMRMLRIKKGLTQKDAAKLLGMKNLYSYQRLESSKQVNPSLAMLERIKQVFPELKVDELLSEA